MNKITIIADSTSDLTEELYSQYNIDIVCLKISFGTETFIDRKTINSEKLFKHVAETGLLPKTAAPTIHELLTIFKNHLDKGEEVIYCPISSEFSSTYSNAIIAINELSEDEQKRIRCLDSRSLSSGIGLIVCHLGDLIKQGKTLEEVYQEGKEITKRVNAEFVVDTMEYLYKGGRCSGVSYYFGSHLHLHPVIRVENGKMVVHKITRGKIKKGMDLQIDEFKKQLDANNVLMDRIFITSPAGSEELDNYMLDKVKSLVGKEYESNIILSHAGSIVSSHCGPRTIGLLYITKNVVI
ncbi:MAG: DegV family protein [Bacilli bacterium]